MEHEKSYWRFFTYLNLFIFSMLLLVLADNLVVMFFGWEGVGLCSYLLIGFWYTDYKKATAGMKAFVVNRVGDFGFICAVSLLFWGMGGSWMRPGHYLSDYRERFVAVQAESLALESEGEGTAHHAKAHRIVDTGSAPGKTNGYLTFTSHPGAKVYLDTTLTDLRLTNVNAPQPFAVSPFLRHEIPRAPTR